VKNYDVYIKWSAEDNYFVATSPGLNRYWAYGGTRAEALKELGILAATHPEYLEAYQRNILRRKGFLHLCSKIYPK
jgi:predicted RNase H-like HicB family nuclease